MIEKTGVKIRPGPQWTCLERQRTQQQEVGILAVDGWAVTFGALPPIYSPPPLQQLCPWTALGYFRSPFPRSLKMTGLAFFSIIKTFP